MLTVEIAPDTEVQIDCAAAKGKMTQEEFEELVTTALVSEDVLNWVREQPKVRIPMPPVNGEKPRFNFMQSH